MARPSSWISTSGRRYGTIEDFRNFVKLAQSSPWLHHSGGTICEPVDVPVNKRHLDMVYSHIKYSDRGFMGSVTAESRAEDSIDMARIAVRRTNSSTATASSSATSTSTRRWSGTPP